MGAWVDSCKFLPDSMVDLQMMRPATHSVRGVDVLMADIWGLGRKVATGV